MRELNEQIFDVLTPEVEYWLGFLMADGNVSGNQIQINLGRKDRGHLEKWKAFVGSSNAIYDGVMPPNGRIIASEYSKFIFSSRYMADKLAEYGVTPRKSHTASATECLVNSADFFRGVVDGDGTVALYNIKAHKGYGTKIYKPRKEAVVSLCGSEYIVAQYKTFVDSVTGGSNKVGRVQGLHTYKVCGAKAQKLAEILYGGATVYLDRKYEAAMQVISTKLGIIENNV